MTGPRLPFVELANDIAQTIWAPLIKKMLDGGMPQEDLATAYQRAKDRITTWRQATWVGATLPNETEHSILVLSLFLVSQPYAAEKPEIVTNFRLAVLGMSAEDEYRRLMNRLSSRGGEIS